VPFTEDYKSAHCLQPRPVSSLNVSTREIALTATMVALYVALSFLPGFPVIGVERATIGILSGVVPIFGFVLGPWLGASATLIGGIVRRVLTGASVFSWLLLPTTILSAFVAGCLTRRRVGVLRGWMVAALILGGLIFAWYLTWVGQVTWVFPLLHWAGLAVVLIFRDWLPLFFQRREGLELTVCVVLCGFVANMVAQMYGTLAFVGAVETGVIGVSLSPLFFLALVPVFAVERLILTVIATVVGVPLVLALRRQFFQS
jgi:predicted membrane protein